MIEIQDVVNEERLEAALQAVLQRAHDNGLTVEGGWKINILENNHSHWDLQIVAVEYDDDEETI